MNIPVQVPDIPDEIKQQLAAEIGLFVVKHGVSLNDTLAFTERITTIIGRYYGLAISTALPGRGLS